MTPPLQSSAPTFTAQRALSRRAFLRAGSVSLALPWLSAMLPAFGADPKTPMKFLGVLNYLGFHAPFLFPKDAGKDYIASPYLKGLDSCRQDFSILSGLSHPEVRDGHSSDKSFFTGAIHPASPSFRNSVSLDQFAATQFGRQTRYPSLNFSTDPGYSCSYTPNGVALPPETSPARAFGKLFINGTPAEVAAELARVREGQSILDSVSAEARTLKHSLGSADREKLDEYLTSVRALEQRMQRSEAYVRKPKPNAGVPPVKDPAKGEDTERLGLMLEVARLAMQADLTRLVTIYFVGTAKTPSKPGSSYAHHDLSHHGQDAGKIQKLAELETDILLKWGDFLKRLREARMIEHTVSVLGAGLGDASSHDATNLPILVGGGGFKHGQHLAFDPKNSPPLCNLWLQILNRIGVEADRFGTSNAKHLPGMEIA